ncbi:Hypothetical protein NCS54_00224200 [Fusarium falciforme]|uniref:Hypothetical protein n=1 Tax=Fusarium falciforme TaxID=195108 RepID=UPI002300DC78|nr:Hypothetical protein NCS54_00224200 [Fusarium falciforme]WAO85009.1 Hypothetical protein NCS54_00224200 [Fusarium falciforme]
MASKIPPPQIPPPKPPPPLFDVLTTTADDLRKRLEAGTITSLEIVESYLSHIEAHNTTGAKCRAVISTPPKFQLIAWATQLNEERRRGGREGPSPRNTHSTQGIYFIFLSGLHATLLIRTCNRTTLLLTRLSGCQLPLDPMLSGTPAQRAMAQSLKMYATPSMSPYLLTKIAQLINCGLIILGKANMTKREWVVRGRGMCEPAYIPTGYKIGEKPRGETTPASSSTGSAVGVASGFAPISVGTKTSGSLVSPAAVAALYALKLTPGSIPMTGVMELTACFDTLGAFGKSALDVALACDALLASHSGTSLASSVASMRLEDVSVGFVDIEKWRLPAGTQVDDPKYFEQTIRIQLAHTSQAREYQQAKDTLRQSGVKVVDAYIIPPEEYMIGDTNVDDLMDKIISYCPNQGRLSGLVTESKPDEEVLEWLEECKRWAATEGIDKVTSEQGVDVVVCCSDSYFAGVSVAARYPMAAVPLGYIESSGRPYGLQPIAPAHQEAKLVRFMAAWERVFPPRRVPDLEACEKARTGR